MKQVLVNEKEMLGFRVILEEVAEILDMDEKYLGEIVAFESEVKYTNCRKPLFFVEGTKNLEDKAVKLKENIETSSNVFFFYSGKRMSMWENRRKEMKEKYDFVLRIEHVISAAALFLPGHKPEILTSLFTEWLFTYCK